MKMIYIRGNTNISGIKTIYIWEMKINYIRGKDEYIGNEDQLHPGKKSKYIGNKDQLHLGNEEQLRAGTNTFIGNEDQLHFGNKDQLHPGKK